FAPIFSDASATFPRSLAEGTVVVDLQATDGPLDVLAWRIAGGDPEGIFGIRVDTGEVFLANRQALLASAKDSWQLQVEVQDSGYDGFFPRKSAAATLTLQRDASGGGSPFEQWAEANGIPGAQPEDDGDHDGVSNLLEFALGGDPGVADADLLGLRVSVVAEGSASWVHLTHRRRQNADAIGLSYALVVSPSLTPADWQPVELSSVGFVPSTEGLPPGYESVTLRLAESLPESASARFYRLEVSLDE
ncbi:MAG: cadherin repeat domain-containing protein, partial [Verrucomicrobiae bacterium]|nr:cadherin repeat domain-containing protein [Verrucomicrobiae bacterium]